MQDLYKDPTYMHSLEILGECETWSEFAWLPV